MPKGHTKGHSPNCVIWTCHGHKHSVSNSVFSVSSYILVLRFIAKDREASNKNVHNLWRHFFGTVFHNLLHQIKIIIQYHSAYIKIIQQSIRSFQSQYICKPMYSEHKWIRPGEIMNDLTVWDKKVCLINNCVIKSQGKSSFSFGRLSTIQRF